MPLRFKHIPYARIGQNGRTAEFLYAGVLWLKLNDSVAMTESGSLLKIKPNEKVKVA